MPLDCRYRRSMRAPQRNHPYTPLNAPYLMSWPARGCNWCGSPEMVWAYPLGEVVFPRLNPEDDVEVEIKHCAQMWYACSRCKPYIDNGQLDELADLLGLPHGYFDRLTQARLTDHSSGKGFPWRTRYAARR